MKQKGITTICLTIILMASIFVVAVEPTEAAEDGPIEIYDWHDLDNVRNNLSANYVLMNDLDENTDGYNESVDTEKGWEPLGYSHDGFSGTFDGQGNEIRGLYINRKGENEIGEFEDGLFRRSDGLIKNIGLVDVNVTGDKKVGGLVGYTRGCTISNSYVTGTVSGTRHIGGLVGWNVNSNITKSYAKVDVDGHYHIGGLIGESYDGSSVNDSFATGNVNGEQNVGGLIGLNECPVSNSYATGNVKGTDWFTGGLVGFNNDRNGEILNSYATGDVNGYKRVGGLTGGLSYSMVTNSYSVGEVSGDGFVSGLTGFAHDSTVSNSFWDIETSGVNNDEYGTGKTSEEMKDVTTFTDMSTEGLDEPWDFVGNPNDDENDEEMWDLDEDINDGYPYLIELLDEPNKYQLTINTKGEGTVEVDGQEVENGWTKEYVEDTELTIEAVTEDGWEFDKWTGIDTTGEEITITMDEDMDITAVFEEEVDEDEEDVGIPGFTLLLVLTAAMIAVGIYKKVRSD